MTQCSIGNKDKVLEYLLDNREHLMELISELKERKELSLNSVPVTFHDDILLQYGNMINKIVIEDVAKGTNVDAETITIMVDEIYMKGFLNG